MINSSMNVSLNQPPHNLNQLQTSSPMDRLFKANKLNNNNNFNPNRQFMNPPTPK